jgi:3-hydroxyacyl-[acyl-carrier-protein] dehydratase
VSIDTDPLAYGLPHREPFIFVDCVLEVVPGSSATCAKTFRPQEPFFRGHFPGEPIVPGVLLTEALAQTAGIAAGSSDSKSAFRLAAIKEMKFRRSVRPSEEITLNARVQGRFGAAVQIDVSAQIGSDVVATGIVVLIGS